MKAQISGRVEAGKMIWDSPGQVAAAFRAFEGKAVLLTVERLKRRRSYLQNAYYWGVLIEMLYAAFRETGEEFGRDDLHELLLDKFLKMPCIGPGGEILGHYVRRSHALDTQEFMDYIAQIQQWAAETFGIVIPDPDRRQIEDVSEESR